jgi:hypothetical protein
MYKKKGSRINKRNREAYIIQGITATELLGEEIRENLQNQIMNGEFNILTR